MYHYRQQINVNYQMATPSSSASSLSKSRGHSLFDRQAQLHAHDPNNPSNLNTSYNAKPLPPLKTSHSMSSPPLPTSSVLYHQHPLHSPILIHRRSPSSTVESYAHSSDDSVQLLSVHPRSESDYIKETLPPVPLAPTVSSKLLETDFPLYEESEKSIPNDLTCAAEVEKAFDYLKVHDDDDDVIHQEHFNEGESNTDSFDDEDEDPSVHTNHFDTRTSTQNSKHDSGIHILSSTGIQEKRNDQNLSQEIFNEQQLPMARRTQTTVSEDYDSDFDDSSHEDDEPIPRTESIIEHEEEQRKQIILRQQQILWGIVQEWLRKEESYSEQLSKMEEQLFHINAPNNIQNLILQLVDQHKKVYHEIEDLYKRQHHPASLTQQLTRTVESLMHTLPVYDDYIKLNLAPTRKLLEKRPNINGLSSEDLLSIPPKQFLQILSQVQDLYQTTQSFESGDKDSVTKLYNYAQRCRLYGSRQDENINKIILKNEDVATIAARGNRDRCRLILYPDAIVSCNLKAKLLASPKYTLLWFIPMLDLQWSIPQSLSDDNHETGEELKTNLKSAYREIERTPKTTNPISSRFTKNLRKHESDFNLAQSKLQLVLSNPSRSSASFVILFSSAYQRQDWIELIDKTKQELLQRNSAVLNSTNPSQRLTDSLIQKRLDFIKPITNETMSNDSPSTIQNISPAKTYSGTLSITIFSIHGPALFNSSRQYQTLPMMSSVQQQIQKNNLFYVAVEIDSYNTFYPYAQTSKQTMQQSEMVEFKGEVFQVELEYSLAFRLLVYRINTSPGNTSTNSQQATCISRFHRDIEPALRDCQQNTNGITCIGSQSGDLELKVSLKYSRRDGTFKRQGSKRSLAVFGKSIEKLIAMPNGVINGIPRIIVKCIECVEHEGLTETGIYRVCCVASDLQKLRHEFDKNCHRGEEMLAQKNVHVAANLLKLFFRELPEPLFTSKLYKEFLNAIQMNDMDNQRVMLLKTFELLDADNRKILLYLFDHLIRVSQYSNTNMMHLDNLAVVFGPTLMRPSKLSLTTYFADNNQRLSASNGQAVATDLDQMSSELQGSMYQCQVVLACLKLRREGILK